MTTLDDNPTTTYLEDPALDLGVLAPELERSLQEQTLNVVPATYAMTVLGTGYLGATHAVCMAILGHSVVGVDVDQTKVDKLNAGIVPFYEPGLDPLLREALDSGRLRFTTDFDDASAFGTVHFLCVGTPQKKGSDQADLSYVEAATRAIAANIRPGALLIGKSTVPVGTSQVVQGLLDEVAPDAGVEVCWNPEFLREGFAVDDTLHPDRLVFGVTSERAEEILRDIYFQPILEGTPVVVADLPTAELVKVAANSFLATKISFINAMAEVCESAGADVLKLRDALSHDTRIGGRFLQPGLGFGGGCLPKDIRAFAARSEEIGSGAATDFLHAVDNINLRRRERVLTIAQEMVGTSLEGLSVSGLGVTFKPNSDDIRDAPALDVAHRFFEAGAHVSVFDPQGMENAERSFPELDYTEGTYEACAQADVVVLLTEWDEFKTIDPFELHDKVRQPNIIDARNVLDQELWESAGWNYRALGR